MRMVDPDPSKNTSAILIIGSFSPRKPFSREFKSHYVFCGVSRAITGHGSHDTVGAGATKRRNKGDNDHWPDCAEFHEELFLPDSQVDIVSGSPTAPSLWRTAKRWLCTHVLGQSQDQVDSREGETGALTWRARGRGQLLLDGAHCQADFR
jgi:hypothetical protein